MWGIFFGIYNVHNCYVALSMLQLLHILPFNPSRNIFCGVAMFPLLTSLSHPLQKEEEEKT
jgi:hypothetical protein